MPVRFSILPQLGLVFTRYTSRATIPDCRAAFGRYAAHPDARPHQTHFVDLSQVTEIDRDYAGMMLFQAQKVAHVMKGDRRPVMIYYAPNPVAYAFARLTQRSWDGTGGATVIVQQDETQALDVLGLGVDRIDRLRAMAG